MREVKNRKPNQQVIKIKMDAANVAAKEEIEFEFLFKTLAELEAEKFEELISKLSDPEEFKNNDRAGVFYKDSTAEKPLTFKDMGLIEGIRNYWADEEKFDEDLLCCNVLLNKKENIIGLVSFYFYEGKLEPDCIIFREFRAKNILSSVITCLITNAFKKIEELGCLPQFQKLYATVHPENLASRRVLERFGFDFKEQPQNEEMTLGKEEKVKKEAGEKPESFFADQRSESRAVSTQTCLDDGLEFLCDDEISFEANSIDRNLLVEVQENLVDSNGKYRLRLVATVEKPLPELFKELQSALESRTDYSEGIEFLKKCQLSEDFRDSYKEQELSSISKAAKIKQDCALEEGSGDGALPRDSSIEVDQFLKPNSTFRSSFVQTILTKNPEIDKILRT